MTAVTIEMAAIIMKTAVIMETAVIIMVMEVTTTVTSRP
jgi:hypothetical protein